MKNILLPIDFSENSENAIIFALELFTGQACTFHLLNVQKALEYTSGDLLTSASNETIYDSLVGNRKEGLKRLIIDLKKRYTGESYEFTAVSGYSIFSEAIQQVIALKKIDLVVMGTDGTTGAGKMVLGSHTLRVIRNASCPVLVIPRKCHYKEIENFLFTVDYGQEYDPVKLSVVFDLVEKKDLKLTVFKMEDEFVPPEEEEKERERTESLYRDLVCSYYSICEVDTLEAVNSLAQVVPVDLNVLLAKKKVLFERLFLNSTISEMINSSKVPLLILPVNN